MTEFIITCQSELQKDGSYKIERYRELVRCKDCKFMYEDNQFMCGIRDFCVNEDFFCADGEKKVSE